MNLTRKEIETEAAMFNMYGTSMLSVGLAQKLIDHALATIGEPQEQEAPADKPKRAKKVAE